MGCMNKIGFESFPKQGKLLGQHVSVCFHYDSERTLEGRIVRDDAEEPHPGVGGRTIIELEDGRFVLDTECQYSIMPDVDDVIGILKSSRMVSPPFVDESTESKVVLGSNATGDEPRTIMEFKNSGEIYYNGRLITEDKEIVDALRTVLRDPMRMNTERQLLVSLLAVARDMAFKPSLFEASWWAQFEKAMISIKTYEVENGEIQP